MVHKWRLLCILITLIALTACSKTEGTPTLAPNQIASTATFTAIPATDTPLPPTETPTIVPTDTSTPTKIPPTSTPEPLLPEGLAQIGADNIAELKLITSLPVNEIYDLAFSSSGNKLATLSEPWDDRFNDYMEVWDLKSGDQILLVDKWDSPHGLFFPPDETTLYAHNRLYDLASGEVISTLEVVPQAFSLDGKTYATGDYKGILDESTIQIIDLATQQEVFGLTHPGMVMNLDFSPDASLLTGGFQVINNFVVLVWDISTGASVIDLINYYSGLTFSPDSSLAAAIKNGQVYIFSTDGMKYQASYGFSDPYANPYIQGFSLNGDILAIDDRYTIRFLVPETGKELFNLPDECAAKFSPDGTILVTWCYQGDLKIWGVMP
jgi:WD40 repeat protein